MSDYVPLTPIGGPTGQQLPPQQSFPPKPPRKSNVIVWVFAICGTLIVIAVIDAFLERYLMRKQMKELGIDPELMQKSPALALAKRVVESNPDVFELSVDDEKRLITIRNKKTGETSTTSLDAKTVAATFAIPAEDEFYKGRDKDAREDMPTWVRNILKEKPGETVYIKSGKEVKYGTVVSLKDSIRDAGSSVKLPDWFPSYPGAVVQGAFSTKSKDGERTYFGFNTNDSIKKVVRFYEENLKRVGLKVNTNTVQLKGVVTQSSLATEDGGKKRIAFVTATSEKGQTQVTVVFAPKCC